MLLNKITRRKFLPITLLGSAAAAWPRVTSAQVGLPLVGFLGSETPDQYASRLRMLQRGLGEVGYVEGRNLAMEYRWAEGHVDRMPALASDLVRRRPAVIAAGSTAAALALKTATSEIPIVAGMASDPVALGLVTSLARPGGNLTGA